jgi:hypothetical protein
MSNHILFLLVLSLISFSCPYAQSYEVKEIKINRFVHGDLYQPDQKSDKLTIIVGGSGPHRSRWQSNDAAMRYV